MPPREGALFNEKNEPWQEARNDAICQITGLGIDESAMKLRKRLVRYHAKSLVERAFSRFKRIFGARLFSRKICSQDVELNLKADVLNEMTKQGMPKGIMV